MLQRHHPSTCICSLRTWNWGWKHNHFQRWKRPLVCYEEHTPKKTIKTKPRCPLIIGRCPWSSGYTVHLVPFCCLFPNPTFPTFLVICLFLSYYFNMQMFRLQCTFNDCIGKYLCSSIGCHFFHSLLCWIQFSFYTYPL